MCSKALGKNVPLEQASALAAGAWNGLSKEKRAPYEHISNNERINYEHGMESYKKKLAAVIPQVRWARCPAPPQSTLDSVTG